MTLKPFNSKDHDPPAPAPATDDSVGATAPGRLRLSARSFDKAPVPNWLVTAPGLWAPRRRGDEGAERLELGTVHVRLGKVVNSLFCCVLSGLSTLRLQDFQVLMVVCQLVAMRSRCWVVDQCSGNLFQEARDALRMAAEVLPTTQLGKVEFTWLELLSSLGLTDTGGNRARLRESMDRLGSITLSATFKDRSISFGLLCADHSLASSVQVFVAPVLLIPGHFKQGVAWIDLAEQRQLKSEAARRLHVWLSWWCSGKQRQRIGFNKLVRHVWGDNGATETAARYRSKCLSKALDQVAMLPGWRIEEDPTGMVTVAMPRRRVAKKKPARKLAGEQQQSTAGSA